MLRSGYGLIWQEQAGITTPFTIPQFPFIQTVTQRSLDGVTPAFVLSAGPNVQPIPLTPDAGLGQGVFSVDRDLGSGYVQQWNLAIQREITGNLVAEVAYAGSKITHVGIPDTNINQLTAEQLAQGNSLLQLAPRTTPVSRGRFSDSMILLNTLNTYQPDHKVACKVWLMRLGRSSIST